MSIKPRRMRINFENVPMHWAAEPTFSTFINSGSILASALEPYMNRVMAKARKVLPPEKAHVGETIDHFIAQEGHHYRVHAGLNKQLFAVYPKLREFEETMKREMAEAEKSQSLLDNLGWCVAFENVAMYIALLNYNRIDLFKNSKDRRIAILFLWHTAEEFEHRSACHDVLDALNGSYLRRIKALFVFSKFFGDWNDRIVSYMLDVDRASMSSEEMERSLRFEKWYKRLLFRSVTLNMAQILLPFYDPGKKKAPPLLERALKEFDGMVMMPEPVGPEQDLAVAA
ncbi:metal-dependent hydrolase [Sphingopyxis sp. 22461]|uniref:metal-dependent hydrolase n=1 Tax=Sphingopyxis sp. 22461 TaxID=3453923 RepID=UPI003F82928D